LLMGEFKKRGGGITQGAREVLRRKSDRSIGWETLYKGRGRGRTGGWSSGPERGVRDFIDLRTSPWGTAWRIGGKRGRLRPKGKL